MFLPVSAPPTICLDPGHPSEVGVGTQGKRLTELHANWTVALRLRDLLRKDGYRVVMTKESERERVTNRRRAEVANAAGAALMVRLHCDGSPRPGFAVYFPDRQGRSGGRTGPSAAVLARTAPLARRFHAALAQGLKGSLVDQGLMSDIKTAVGGRQGAVDGFGVQRGAGGARGDGDDHAPGGRGVHGFGAGSGADGGGARGGGTGGGREGSGCHGCRRGSVPP